MKKTIRRPSAQDIIDAIVASMKNGEEIFDAHFSMVPSIFEVLLHTEDFEEVQFFLRDIVEYAHKRLDRELLNMNQERASNNAGDHSSALDSPTRSGSEHEFVKRAGTSLEN